MIQDWLSDHYITVTALTSELAKENAKVKLYRDYKPFNVKIFKTYLPEHLKNNSDDDYSNFLKKLKKHLINTQQ